ncbi:polysaccharide biosynthesis tyrosine autokinase [Halomonas beimenensis]|uniref:Tyrosine-protein kinase Wzc n=1 Tax=Halomonas beimenensis TaxID=475662 RepID=A0A291P8G2_9GAMM|nr:polysaccharide biosynthesis tyrosine autokinase [Halomonas beimenensis]ATJ83142.1 tyrosine-protein kinase Wzc [Halomonas beimenensis]
MNRVASNQYEDVDLGRVMALLAGKRGLIFLIMGLFTLAGATYALLATPIYRGDALVQVERMPTSPLEDVASTMLGEDPESSTAAEVQILQSRMVLGQVVERTGLDTAVLPERLPLVGDFLVRRGIPRPSFMQERPEVWAGESLELGILQVDEPLRGTPLRVQTGQDGNFMVFMEGERPRFLGAGQVGELLEFEEGAIRLRIANLQAPRGARFMLIKYTRAAAIEDFSRRLRVQEVGSGRAASTGMLRLTLTGEDREEIRLSLNEVAETFLRQNIQRQSAEIEQSLAFLREQAPELREQLRVAEDSLNRYRVEQHSVDLSSEAQATIQQFVALDSQLNELEFQEAELSQRFKPNHPTYQALLEQKRHLQNERDELNARVNELPLAQQEVVRRTRDVEVTQAIYVNVLNRMQELEVARAGTVGNVRIIDKAEVGVAPIEPRKPIVVLLATMGGGLFGVGLVLVQGVFNRGIESPAQLENAGLPVYATIPLSDEQKKLVRRVKHLRARRSHEVMSDVLASRNPSAPAVEALRGLRTSLHFAMLEAADNRLMLTGPSPGIGKSFICLNLGFICAQAGQKVLVIDADMRKGRMHHAFGGRGEGGLSEVLSGTMRLEEVVRTTQQEGLCYVARGVIPPNPSELLMNARFSEFLAAVSRRFELVILDTPPVLAVTDAAVVGAQCGTALLVARFQDNPMRDMQISKRRLETSGVSVKGAILNAMARKASAYYGYCREYYHYS